MAKKIKYYGVFAVKSLDNTGLVKLMTDVLDLPELPRKQIKVFVFDNELEQMKCLSNLPTEPGDILISIDSTSKDEFMKKVYELKEEHSKPVEEEVKCNKYTVLLTEVADNEKLLTVKTIKETLDIGLKEAKDLVDDVPSILADSIDFEKADAIAKTITSKCNCKIEVCTHGNSREYPD